MKSISVTQLASEESGQQDPSFWSLIKKVKAGDKQASRDLRNHPRVVKMILVICISLMRRNSLEYRDIETIQKEVGLRIQHNLTSFEGKNERDFGRWLWGEVRSQFSDEAGNAKKRNLIEWWKNLSDRERQILKLRVGGHDLMEIGQMLPGRESGARVHQDLMQALIRLELTMYRCQDSSLIKKEGKPWKRKVKKKEQTPR